MNMKRDDTQIKQLFEELRRQDERSVPDFHELLNRETGSRSGTVGGFWLRYRMAASMAVLAILLIPVAVYFGSGNGTEQTPLSAAVAVEVTDWESPTDFLMSFPGESLIDEVPDLETETPNWVTTDDWSVEM